MVSPFAPVSFPLLAGIDGVELATCSAEIKYLNRDDMLLVRFSENTNIAGVFTQSSTPSAPVAHCKKVLGQSRARALLVNSDNANAFTGRTGDEHCMMCCQAVADEIGCEKNQVFLASTGVIGEPLPINRMLGAIPILSKKLGTSSWECAAKAITTTDTFSKGASIKTNIDGVEVSISGIAKGAGMIAPDMATMLSFVFTDATIPQTVLQQLLSDSTQYSFNAITVDSDTSTSDTCFLFATGSLNNVIPEDINDPVLNAFKQALDKLVKKLARQIICDGEGISKFIEVRVTGAESEASAKIVAMSIANSPLVKTAIAGEDANWGRVVMAVGKSGQRVDRDTLKIKMGDVVITDQGQAIVDYDEAQLESHLKQAEILIEADLGIGEGQFVVWTCDLTHGYISINADYRS